MSINFNPTASSAEGTVAQALSIAQNVGDDIKDVLDDIQPDSKINDRANLGWDSASGLEAANKYGYDLTEPNVTIDPVTGHPVFNDGAVVDISQASGAMVVDDLMQKMSTKVQVAAQMLAGANNIQKTASRILSQG